MRSILSVPRGQARQIATATYSPRPDFGRVISNGIANAKAAFSYAGRVAHQSPGSQRPDEGISTGADNEGYLRLHTPVRKKKLQIQSRPWLWVSVTLFIILFATVRINLLSERMKKQIDELDQEAIHLNHELQERRSIASELIDYSKIEPLARSRGLHSPTSHQLVAVTGEINHE